MFNDYIAVEVEVFLRQKNVDFLKKNLLIKKIIMEVKYFKRL